MNATLQTAIALTLVVMTALAFLYRWWKSRKKTGCGGGCSCSANKFKK